MHLFLQFLPFYSSFWKMARRQESWLWSSGCLGGVILTLHTLFFEAKGRKKLAEKPNVAMVDNMVYNLKH